MTPTGKFQSKNPLVGLSGLMILMLAIFTGCPELWSQTYQNIGVEVGPMRPTGFIDAFKDQGRLFVNPNTNSTSCALVPTDGSGNPTTDAMVVVFDNRPIPEWLGYSDDPALDQPNPSGTYTISFTGYASVTNAPITQCNSSSSPALTLSTPVYNSATNTTTLTAYMPGGVNYNNGAALMVLNFTNTQLNGQGTTTNTGIANLQVIRPGFTVAQANSQIFDPAVISALSPFNYLRFMNWLGTNTCPYYTSGTTPLLAWSQRSLPTDVFQGLAGNVMGAPCYGTTGIPTGREGSWGVSWEYVILIANATNKDIWINLPISATGGSDPKDPTYVASPDTSSYIYNLAYLLKNGNAFTGNKGLNAGLHIYIEHSNEVWNSGFRQNGWNEGAASDEVALGGSVLNNDGSTDSNAWAARRHLKRLYEISQIFQSVFGAGSLNTTIRPVYAWWQLDPGNGAYAANALAWFKNTYGPPANYFYAMAQGDYFSPSSDTNSTVNAVLNDMQADSSADISYIQSNLTTAQQYGLPLFAYEGGPGNTDPDAPDSYLQYQIDANRIYASQNGGLGIDELVENHVRQNWAPYGGANFGYFMFSSAYSRYGSFGVTDDYCNLTTPKYSAILNLTGYTPGTPSIPQNLTAAAGNQTVVLNWPAVASAANYVVQRSQTSGGPYTTLATACTPGYTDQSVSNGTTYYYVVEAVGATGQATSASSQVIATPSATLQPPGVPTALTASPGSGQVLLSWTAPTTGGAVASYQVWDSTGASYSEVNSAVTGTSFNVTGLTNNTQYSFYVTASNSAGTSGDSNIATATPTASLQSQTITFTQPTTPVTYGVSPITLQATASSGLAVTFSIVSGPGTVSGSTLTFTGAGTVVVAANQAGNATYSAAPQVTRSIVVNQESQTITFTQPTTPVTYPVSPIALSATASSGLAVTFSVVSGPGTVSGSTLTITGTGTVVVAANQAGNTNYAAAAQVTRSIVVNSGSGGGGTLLAYEPFGEASGTPLNGATGSGDSGWGYAWVEQSGSTTEPGYEILSTTPLTYTGLQTAANYAIGGYGYQSAGRQLNVTAGGPFNSYLSSGLIGASGQTVWLSFLVREDANPSNGQINAVFLNNYAGTNSWVPQTGIGIGYFGGTADWGLQLNNGTPVLSSVPVTQGQPTLLVVSVTFGSTNQVNLYVNPTSLGGSAPTTPSATFSTTSSVAFESLAYLGGYGTNDSSLADIRFGTSYAVVTPPSLQAQTITFTQPATPVTYGVSPIALSATASSSLPVTFSIVSGPGTISGSALTITGAGTVVVAANQAGNATYSPAPQVTRSIVVNQASQTISFTQPTTPVTYPVSPVSLSATASSGLAVTFSVVSGPATVSGSTLTITGTGTVVVAANQAGNTNYAAAAQVTRSIVVNAGSGGGGTLLAYEPFGEASGTPLNGATGSGDSGWGYAWVEQFGSTAEPGYEILSANPLTYTGLQTTSNYAIGGYSYQSAGRQLNVASGGPFNSYLSNGLIGASGQTVWLSFLIREDANPSNGQINAVFLNADAGGDSWVPQTGIGIGYFGGTADWGLQLNNGTPVLSSVAVTQGQSTLLVVSITFGSTNQVNLYVNPTSLGGSAPTTPSATFSTTTNIAFESLAYLGGYGTNDSSLADIRFGTTFAAVTP